VSLANPTSYCAVHLVQPLRTLLIMLPPCCCIFLRCSSPPAPPALLLLGGAVIYACRIPERWCSLVWRPAQGVFNIMPHAFHTALLTLLLQGGAVIYACRILEHW
jgi:hypothetical protein